MTGLAEKTLPGRTAGGSPLPQTGAPAGILPLGVAAIVLIGAGLGLARRKEEKPTEE
jgi:LPXTG-motif cell wall-anchored protein